MRGLRRKDLFRVFRRRNKRTKATGRLSGNFEGGKGLESSLNIFFDETADRNLPIESIYTLAAGLLNMFKKIVLTHGVG